MAKGNTPSEKKQNIFGKIADLFVGIGNEARKVRWPKFTDLMSSTGKVLVFCILFAVFFILCDLLVSELLVLIGVGA